MSRIHRPYNRPAKSGEPRRPDKSASRRHGKSVSVKVNNYFIRHAQVFVFSLGRLVRAPFASLLTAAVIGIALALPAGLHVLLTNANSVSGGWDGAAQISLFLKQDVSDDRAQRMVRHIEAKRDVGEASLIRREQALEEFKRTSGFGDALKALKENPLPSVIAIRPAVASNNPTATSRLLVELRKMPEVDIAQLDMQWVRRLYAIMDIARRGILVIGALLGLAVLLVIGNTIRLDIENRRDEIVITKLIGGTDAFIRRPFLYSGFWYGTFGGLIAWLLVTLSLQLVKEPIARLSGLYHSNFNLIGLDLLTTGALFGGAALLGLFGSWLAVSKHLSAIEPT